MSLPILQACKKRKTPPKLYQLNTFCDPGCPIQPVGPFRDNIRLFVQECAVLVDYTLDSMPLWSTLLVQHATGVAVPLYTIEENVRLSPKPFCDHCRCSGWSHHYMSKRKYHIIIPLESEWNKPLNIDVFDSQSHLLHGVIHCNGFGHLLCINGIEGGSKYLSGKDLMSLWDRICSNLHTRKITVNDTSKKRSMDLRLLHGIAYGKSWFGRWGYKFSHGCFGVQAHHYQRAVEILSSIDLNELLLTLPEGNSDATRIIASYRQLSKIPLITLRDLLKFMLTLKPQTHTNPTTALLPLKSNSQAPVKRVISNQILKSRSVFVKGKQIKLRKFESLIATMDTRWPKRRLEYTAGVIVAALKEHKGGTNLTKTGMTRQEVRDAARAHIGDTGLIDYVLKSMNNVLVGNYIVRRNNDTVNKVLVYTIQKFREKSSTVAPEPSIYARNSSKVAPEPSIYARSSGNVAPEPSIYARNSSKVAPEPYDVLHDVYTICKEFILNRPDSDILGLSARVILDSKHLVKEWPFDDDNDQLLRFICRVPSTSYEMDVEVARKFSPGELVVLPLYASFDDLKVTAQHALRDTYCVMECYMVSEIENLDSLMDDEVVFGAIESGSEIWVRGSGLNLNSEFTYEAGPVNWTVRCSCGATDDDGERMLSCDICEVWQHTRCSDIDDADGVPPLFVCQMCCSNLMPPRVETVAFPEDSRQPWGAIHC